MTVADTFIHTLPPTISGPDWKLFLGKEGGRGATKWAGASGEWGASGETRAERPHFPVRFLTCELGVPAQQVWGSPGRYGERVKLQARHRLPGGLTGVQV